MLDALEDFRRHVAQSLPVCRAQMDITYKIRDRTLIENMPGFHWETIYGDYLREVGYALKKLKIEWENVSEKA